MSGVSEGEPITVLQHVMALLAQMELRHQQRYEAQTKAVDAALQAAERAVQTAMTAAEKAVAKAEAAAEKRFDSVNEFRAAYQDIIALQMPRAEAEQRLSALAEKIGDLKAGASQTSGRTAGLNTGWGYLVGAVGIIAAVTAMLLR